MKGLLLKDWYVTKNNRRLFYMICILSIMFLLTDMEVSFMVSYFTMFAAMLSISTISTDEQKNSIAFYLTFPVTRKAYAAEKYLFGFLLTMAAWLLSFTLVAVFLRPADFFPLFSQSLIGLDIAFWMLLLLIPVQLKFGADTGRIVLVCIILSFITAGALLKNAAEFFHWNFLSLFTERITSFGPLPLITVLAFLHLPLLGISYRLSVRFVSRREF